MTFLYDVPDDGPDHWTLVYRAMKQVTTPAGAHLSMEAASVYVTDNRYLAFADLVSPLGWMAAAQQSTFTPAGRGEVTYGGRTSQVVARLLDSGPEPILMRAMPDLTDEEWRRRILNIYQAEPPFVEPEDEPEDEPWTPPALVQTIGRGARGSWEPEQPTGAKPVGPVAFTPAERQAKDWSAEKGLPRHNIGRRSQTPVGRHERGVVANARKWGISEPEAHLRMTCKHEDCRWHK